MPSRARRLLPLALLVAVCTAPMLAAWALYLNPELLPARRAHHGTLIEPPASFPATAFRTASGATFGPEHWQEKWSLLWVSEAAGRQDCAATLQRMRNLRIALREHGVRLRLLALSLDAGGTSALLDAEVRHADVSVLAAPDVELPLLRRDLAAIGGADLQQATGFYIVDPLGKLMMRYEPGADARGMLEDLERLLSYSRLGR